jgi:DNA polymerase-3 subunit gamma/tau
MYQVLARKWRPQTFDDLVGQRHVARALANAITSDRLAHAYIFSGLRGTGKTTVARILAKGLNCERGATPRPCGACASCQEIAQSRALDVLEIDAASRTKVEQTRELLDIVSYAPVRDRNRILIIDEAHMLSKASFNALLKTLEEPPPNVVFVLATTEIQKIPSTILSRCQIFEFRRVPPRELARHLRRICDEERITVSDMALERLARAGEGSVRDSLSALERVVAFCGSTVDDDDVLRLLGAVRIEVLTEMVAALAGHDAAGMLRVLDRLVDEGHDLLHFWSELIAVVRDLLLRRTLPDAPDLLARSAEEAAALDAAAQGLSREDLTRVFQILADLEFGLKSSSQPQYLFEATLIRLAGLAAVRPIEELLRSAGRMPVAASPAPQKKNPVEAEPPAMTAAALAPAREAAGDAASEVVARVREARPMLGAILEQATRIELEGGVLAIELPAAIGALQRQLEEGEGRALIARLAQELSGAPVRVRVETARAESATAPPPTAPVAEPPRLTLEKLRREPGVAKLLQTFGAQVVDIELFEIGPPRLDGGEAAGPPEEA